MIHACVFTNLRRPELLLATLGSLTRAGLHAPAVYCDGSDEPSPGNHARGYIEAMAAMTRRADAGNSAWLLLCEDDIAVPVGFGDYLPHLRSLLAPWQEVLGFVSLFCSVGYRDWAAAHPVAEAPRFGRLIPNDCFAGTQCLLFPPAAAGKLMPIMQACREKAADWGGDRILGEAARQLGLEAWCHVPSLVDHRGRTASTVTSRADNLAMIAADYVGENWELEDGS